MLIGIDPLLGPDCLALLRAMGHGDELVLADANFPAARVARRIVRLDGVPLGRTLEAVLGLLPIDEAEPQPILAMDPASEDPTLHLARIEMQAIVDRVVPHAGSIGRLDRRAFYDRAAAAFGVIVTGDRRFYANLILRKGTISLEG